MPDIQTLFSNLKSSDQAVRKEASLSLIAMEQQQKLPSALLCELLVEHSKDPVVTVYACEAIARAALLMDDKSGFETLARQFKSSSDVFFLLAVLQCFRIIKDSYILPVVLQRVAKSRGLKLISRAKFYLQLSLNLFSQRLSKKIFTSSELDDEILLAALKYFQTCLPPEKADKIKPFLKHSDSLIRYHTLMVFSKMDIKLEQKLLKKIAADDKDSLNREQAQLMLEL